MTELVSIPENELEAPERSSKMKGLRKRVRSVGRKAKAVCKVTANAMRFQLNTVASIFTMCSANTVTEEIPDEVIYASVPSRNNSRVDLAEQPAETSASEPAETNVPVPAETGASEPEPEPAPAEVTEEPACIALAEPVTHAETALVPVEAASAQEPAVPEETAKEETHLPKAAAKDDISVVFCLSEFIREIEDIVQNTSLMPCASYAPGIILFYLKQKRNHLHEQLKNIELAFHTTPDSASPTDMDQDVVKFLVAEALEPTECISHWLSSDEPLQAAYTDLYKTIIKTLFEENKQGTRTERTIVFYCQALKYIRTVLDLALQDVEQEPLDHLPVPHLFTDLLSNLSKPESVSALLEARVQQADAECNEDLDSEYIATDGEEEHNTTAVPDPAAMMETLMTSPLFQKQREMNILEGNIVEDFSHTCSPEMQKGMDAALSYIMQVGVPTPIARCLSPKNI
ncbi:uncharacterized protein NESG_01758 [Nematocida ausubeli]|uniref:Uncharacterized protein n=1 Tax=Nematocida ausubeli (strain ATCC PRA-371 / ERTm2) TaxID=1913371 RepID=A0A086J0V6_NEMA1|nr:uncharacterized protein NESG_01758 [Nematocida ausubeli]KFG25774.1 hypothetical protein NESG_01758 [Nematocida ausubeli]